MSGSELGTKRRAARLSGDVVAAAAGISRTALARLESGISFARPEDLDRVDAALDVLLAARRQLGTAARALGWPGVNIALT